MTEQSFARKHFGNAQLGDARRTRRLVAVAEQITRHPGGTLPHKLKSPAGLKGLYRLCQSPRVTHEAVLAPHRQWTLEQIDQHAGTLLVIHDTTELDYTSLKSLSGLGRIGNGGTRGYLCHNSLVVDPRGRQVIGLAEQILYTRHDVPKNEPRRAQQERDSRESRLWQRGTARLPRDARLIDVCDRGADTFEFLEHELHSGRRFVVRAWQDRLILTGHGDGPTAQTRLFAYLRQQPELGRRTVTVQETEDRPGRKAEVAICAAAVRVLPPKHPRGQHGDQPLALWCVCVREINPPKGVQGLEWVLFTNEACEDHAAATRVHGWYEQRWVIEEYHKSLKTGCSIEHLQFSYEERLQPVIAILSVVALSLLNLREMSRGEDAKTRPAQDLFASEYIHVLSGWRYKEIRSDMTIHDYFLALARLGGHQNRCSDHLPGWLVLWRGWTTLQAMVDGATAFQRPTRCG